MALREIKIHCSGDDIPLNIYKDQNEIRKPEYMQNFYKLDLSKEKDFDSIYSIFYEISQQSFVFDALRSIYFWKEDKSLYFEKNPETSYDINSILNGTSCESKYKGKIFHIPPPGVAQTFIDRQKISPFYPGRIVKMKHPYIEERFAQILDQDIGNFRTKFYVKFRPAIDFTKVNKENKTQSQITKEQRAKDPNYSPPVVSFNASSVQGYQRKQKKINGQNFDLYLWDDCYYLGIFQVDQVDMNMLKLYSFQLDLNNYSFFQKNISPVEKRIKDFEAITNKQKPALIEEIINKKPKQIPTSFPTKQKEKEYYQSCQWIPIPGTLVETRTANLHIVGMYNGIDPNPTDNRRHFFEPIVPGEALTFQIGPDYEFNTVTEDYVQKYKQVFSERRNLESHIPQYVSKEISAENESDNSDYIVDESSELRMYDLVSTEKDGVFVIISKPTKNKAFTGQLMDNTLKSFDPSMLQKNQRGLPIIYLPETNVLDNLAKRVLVNDIVYSETNQIKQGKVKTIYGNKLFVKFTGEKNQRKLEWVNPAQFVCINRIKQSLKGYQGKDIYLKNGNKGYLVGFDVSDLEQPFIKAKLPDGSDTHLLFKDQKVKWDFQPF